MIIVRRKIIGFFGVLFFTMSAEAEWSKAINPSDLKSLPRYCNNLSTGNYTADALPLLKRGKAPGVKHLHHYCHGLKWLNRARSTIDPSERKNGFREAGAEFEYVYSHIKKESDRGERKYVLYMANTLVNRGKAAEGVHDYSRALSSYYEAIKVKPNYTKAYIGLINLHRNQGNIEEAMSVVDSGLKVIPKSKSLARYKKKLLAE